MRSTLAGGVDEAGRGCVVGPLVVAGVSADKVGVRKLRRIGVKDSKLLAPKKRESLYDEIVEACVSVRSERIPTEEIDSVVNHGIKYMKLNYLEGLYFAKVIDGLDATTVTVDASDVIPRRFRDVIQSNLKTICRVRAYHKADRDFPLVSAASIIAKVERDREVERLRSIHGDFGSGYPSDPKTKDYFTRWLKNGNSPPDWTRKSWKSWQNYALDLWV